MLVLTRHSFCFVSIIGQVSGVVLRDDINKPVVRMWLFGIVTIIEMYLTTRIRNLHGHEGWQSLLSKSRREKAMSFYNERKRRNQSCDLLDCLQLSDKLQLLLQDEELLGNLGFETKRQAKATAKELESLRNNLAHAQDIVAHDWGQIARLARNVENIL